MPKVLPQRPLIIAHRGASFTYPENTDTAFRGALRARADAIELDVQLSADGYPVVFHDKTLMKVTGERTPISDLTYRQLSKIDNGSWFDNTFKRERILSLHKTLATYGKKTHLLIEIKAWEDNPRSKRLLALTQKTIDTIRSLRMEGKVSVLSYEARLLRYAHQQAPDLRYLLNLRAPIDPKTILRQWRHIASGVCISIRDLNADCVRLMHDGGMTVFTFSCNTSREVNRAVRAGADGVMSDKPLWLRHYLMENKTVETRF
jgi:glycerophosphoryl diester phosphodiesterase